MRGAGMKTPLIVLSAIGDEMDKVLLLEIGADDYVVKPSERGSCWRASGRCCGGPHPMKRRCCPSATCRSI